MNFAHLLNSHKQCAFRFADSKKNRIRGEIRAQDPRLGGYKYLLQTMNRPLGDHETNSQLLFVIPDCVSNAHCRFQEPGSSYVVRRVWLPLEASGEEVVLVSGITRGTGSMRQAEVITYLPRELQSFKCSP